MKKTLFVFIVLIGVLAISVSAQTEKGIEVLKVSICTDVIEREAVGVDTVFSASAEKLYCHTTFANGDTSRHITHVWKYEGEEVFRKELNIKKSGKWRTWTSKKVNSELRGAWKVRIINEDGDALATKSFIVK
ncbi:MAG: DUF2914 domain-containing protein [Candidatus Marinimicrobia bacterium]|nr:DUF2914 domain-containing protein [Candidatus Neomarinimicrobiota bacterium]